ncbi:hypothetical protein B296_00001784 [Ensete ventricosum]|uniref:Uncharacterized protein n=1 Tax=Ensete ventricosum TaxID=4639 RepID=A0A427AB74_ENSVE|nr:hypothetical protein B296_00001784 [Ensete ventricosum]
MKSVSVPKPESEHEVFPVAARSQRNYNRGSPPSRLGPTRLQEIYKACSLPMSILPKPPSVRRRSTFLHLVDSERSSGKRSEGHP